MSKQASAIGHDVDVAVIGSGFGGAAVACRLAQAGKKVVILEQGKQYPTGRFDYEATGHGVATNRYGHFWVDIGVGMNVIRGIGVGGGSLHYFGVRLRTHPDIFENPRWPRSINRKVLDPYYDLADDMVKAAPTEPHPVLGRPAHGEAFIAAAKNCCRCKTEPHYVPIAVNTGTQLIETAAGVPQTPCVFCGECLIGCPPSQSFGGYVNARALLTLNYLAIAQRMGNATIYPLHRVRWIERAREGFEIDLIVLDPSAATKENDEIGQCGKLRAKQVVLAAGTMGSVELLLKSKEKGYLPEISDQLGLHFSGNGDFVFARTMNTPQNLQPTAGPSITAGADFSTSEHKIFIEDLGLSPVVEAVQGTRQNTVSATNPYQ
jgi:cholesterol oxidase